MDCGGVGDSATLAPPVTTTGPVLQGARVVMKVASLSARILILLLAAWAAVPSAIAAEATFDVNKASATLDAAEALLGHRRISESEVAAAIAKVNAVHPEAQDCVTGAEGEVAKIQADLKRLGPRVRGEPIDVVRKRVSLEQQQKEKEQTLASCRLLVLRTDDLSHRLGDVRDRLLAERLFARGPDFFSLLWENWSKPAVWWDASRTFVVKHSGLDLLSGWPALGLIISVLVAIGLARFARPPMLRRVADDRLWDVGFSSRLNRALLREFAASLMSLAGSLAAAIYLLVIFSGVSPVPFVGVVAYGLPAYFLLTTLLQALLAPHPPAEMVFSLTRTTARVFARRFRVLLLLLFVGYLLFSTLLAQSLPASAFLLARAVFAGFLIVNLIWVVLLFGRFDRFARSLVARIGLVLALVAMLLAEWAGYRNLSIAALRAAFGTVVLAGAYVLARQLLRDVFAGLDTGRRPWHRSVRQFFGLAAGEPVPGLIWIHLIVTLILWGVAVALLLQVWGQKSLLLSAYDYFINGFTVGSLTIAPLRIILAAGSFAILIVVSGWFRARLERRWLAKARLDRGAREALVTISGYGGIALALLVALGVAGLTFSNLAIIAGALSVGIGFGLQNVVNNFVSGLILLFERPVKTGDWVVVGNTEGYVRRIRIRSTQIETFDRADVIVPNSELISNQVTNWMLYDQRGRIRVPVGVAYGSDVDRVAAVLTQVAEQHPDVVKDDSSRGIKVLFREFGDSSLDFELRCHIRNIDRRLDVISDMNFAIDRAFRENGIEIPFPQRDLHVRSWTPGASPDGSAKE
jgi:potassium efflux system protein